MSVKSRTSGASSVFVGKAPAPSANPSRAPIANVGPAIKKPFRTWRRSTPVSRTDMQAPPVIRSASCLDEPTPRRRPSQAVAGSVMTHRHRAGTSDDALKEVLPFCREGNATVRYAHKAGVISLTRATTSPGLGSRLSDGRVRLTKFVLESVHGHRSAQQEPAKDDVTSLGSLADPSRRALYEFVSRQAEPSRSGRGGGGRWPGPRRWPPITSIAWWRTGSWRCPSPGGQAGPGRGRPAGQALPAGVSGVHDQPAAPGLRAGGADLRRGGGERAHRSGVGGAQRIGPGLRARGRR